MKISKIELNAFRAYKNKNSLSFKSNNEISNFILLYGPNGYGKTSFFDAIEWSLTGKISRIDKEDTIFERKRHTELDSKIKQHILKNKHSSLDMGEIVIETESERIFNFKTKKLRLGMFDYKPPDPQKIKILEGKILTQEGIDNFFRKQKPSDRYILFKEYIATNNSLKKLDDIRVEIVKLHNKLNQNISNEKDQIQNLEKEISSTEPMEINENFNIIEFIDSLNKTIQEINKSLNLDREFKNFSIKDERIDLNGIKILNNNLNLYIKRLKRKLKDLDEISKKISDYYVPNNDFINKKLNDRNFVIKKKEFYNRFSTISNNDKKLFDEIYNNNNFSDFDYNYIFKFGIIYDLEIMSDLINIWEDINKFTSNSKNTYKKSNLNRKNNIPDNQKLIITRFYRNIVKSLDEINYFFENEKITHCPICAKEYSHRDLLMSFNQIYDSIEPLVNDDYEYINKNTNKYQIYDSIKNEIKSVVDSILEVDLEKSRYHIYNIRKELEFLSNKEFLDIPKFEHTFKKIAEFDYKNKRIKKIIFNFFRNSNISFEILRISKKFNSLMISVKKVEYLFENINSLWILQYDCTQQLIQINNFLEELNENRDKINFYQKILEKREILAKIDFHKNEILTIQTEQKKIKKGLNYINNLIKKEVNLFFETDNINAIYEKLSPNNEFHSIELYCTIESDSPNIHVFAKNLSDKSTNKNHDKFNSPELYFSSAQLNLLSICVFLAKALKKSEDESEIDTIFLDDPIQNMDGINVLSFIDLIRLLIQPPYDFQIIISTHNPYLYHLFRQKIPPKFYNSSYFELTNKGLIKKIADY